MYCNSVCAGDSISRTATQANLLAGDNASGRQLCAREIHTLGENPVFNE